MDIEVLKKNVEPLMHRTYFEAKVVFSGKTPARTDLIKTLCQKLSSKDTLTVIRKITTDYGSERAILTGYVYEEEKKLKDLENKHTLLRHLPKAEQKAQKEKVKAAKQAIASAKAAAKKKK